MNDLLLAVLLGIVEGLTEFLPVSSTAHIRITQALCGIDLESGYWKMFSVVIQLPAILAVVVHFRARLASFVASFLRGGRRLRHPLTLVAIAFVVTALPAFALSKLIKQNLESLWIMGAALIVGGVAMWGVDAWAARRERRGDAPLTRSLEEMSPLQAAWIGAVQVLSAIFPGVSRSMSTIVAGQLAGLTRPTALEFSFFVSIPIMAAACLFDLRESLTALPGEPAHIAEPMDGWRWATLAVGSLVSFVVAWGVIAWFMNWVRRRGFAPFALYRIVVGAGVLALAASR